MLPELKVKDLVEILNEDWKTFLKSFEEFFEAEAEKEKLSSSADVYCRLNQLTRLICEAVEEEVKSSLNIK